MDQGAHLDALLRGEAGGQAKHFSAVGLARKISQRPWIEALTYMDGQPNTVESDPVRTA
jgi:hypothetical protein